MPHIELTRSVPIERTPRVLQMEGLFDVPPSQASQVHWSAHVPIEQRDWQIGLIVGPSGCGKTTLARELYPQAFVEGFDWPEHRSLVDGFPAGLGIREITGLLSSVGFSSPPSWLRPFRVLSNGEQFRATLARALAERPDLAVIDEFTSVIDRTVAQIGSAALAKAVRSRPGKFVAVSCHYDILEWLQPDWVYEPSTDLFQWRCLQRRPAIELEITRAGRDAWRLFRPHHYLRTDLAPVVKCFVARVNGRPAAFTAAVHFPHPQRPCWREHRTVCLPDFQGVGIGNSLSELVAGVMLTTGKPYHSTTSHPAMIRHRLASPLWRTVRLPSMVADSRHRGWSKRDGQRRRSSHGRLTASFAYCGPVLDEEARKLDVCP